MQQKIDSLFLSYYNYLTTMRQEVNLKFLRMITRDAALKVMAGLKTSRGSKIVVVGISS